MAEECLRIDIPYPVHTPVRFPYPVQAAGTAAIFVVVFPVPAAGQGRLEAVAAGGSQAVVV